MPIIDSQVHAYEANTPKRKPGTHHKNRFTHLDRHKNNSFPLRGKVRMGVGLNDYQPIPTLALPLKGREDS